MVEQVDAYVQRLSEGWYYVSIARSPLQELVADPGRTPTFFNAVGMGIDPLYCSKYIKVRRS